MTVTTTRPDAHASGEIRNGPQTRRPEALTGKGTGELGSVPQAVTCRDCKAEIPPDKWLVVDGTEERQRMFCWDCARAGSPRKSAYSDREYATYTFPWLTRGARLAGRTRDDYLHRCGLCSRLFVGVLVRQWCSHECGERARAGRRDRTRDRHARPCDHCGDVFTPPRDDGRYCKPACRQKAYRARLRGAS